MPHNIYSRTGIGARLLPAVFLLILSAAFAQATNLRFAWNASSDPNVVGYNLSYGTTSGRYTQTANAGNSTSTTVSLTPGATYYFAVTAYNSFGLQSLPSNEVSLTVTNVPPSVALTSPQSGATLDGNSAIGLTASASDSDGSITKVEFYQDTTKIGESSSAPYAATWSNAPSGNFVLTALAYDNAGAAVRSTGVPVTVTGTTPAPSPSPGVADKVRVLSLTPIVRAGGMARFKVVASQMNATQDTVVNYSLTGTATSGLNYSTSGVGGGNVTIPMGKRSVLMPMQTLVVPGSTGGTTAVMTVLPGTGYTPGHANAVVKIVNH